MTVNGVGPLKVFINDVKSYTASSPDGALPSSAAIWTANGAAIQGTDTGSSVNILFNTASSGPGDLKKIEVKCGNNSASVDVCVMGSDSVAPVAGVSAITYKESIIAPTSGNWGEMTPQGTELSVDIMAYYDAGSDSWKAKVTKAESAYTIWWRLLSGVSEASLGAATAANCLVMIQDLSALGGPLWYKLSAVEAHERVHVQEWKSSLNPQFLTAKASIESLSVPNICGMNAETAAAQIKGLAAYNAAINQAIADAKTIFWAVPDPNANTDAAEHAVVDPLVTAISAKAVSQGWPSVCH